MSGGGDFWLLGRRKRFLSSLGDWRDIWVFLSGEWRKGTDISVKDVKKKSVDFSCRGLLMAPGLFILASRRGGSIL